MHLHLSLLVPLVTFAITSTTAYEATYPPSASLGPPSSNSIPRLPALKRRQLPGPPYGEDGSQADQSLQHLVGHGSSTPGSGIEAGRQSSTNTDHHERHIQGKQDRLREQPGPAHTYFRDRRGKNMYRLQKTSNNKFKTWKQDRPAPESKIEQKYLSANEKIAQDPKSFRYSAGGKPWGPTRSGMSEGWQQFKGAMGARREHPGSMYIRGG